MYYTIYKITNQINGKFYIGSHKTKNLNDGYMGSGKYLKYAQEKYGINNFTKEILHVFNSAEEMYVKEAEIVNKDFLIDENTYNLKVGGFGGFDFVNKIRTTEERQIAAKKSHTPHDKLFSRENQPNRGRVFINNGIDNRLIPSNQEPPNDWVFGRIRAGGVSCHTPETKMIISAKNSILQKGSKNSQYGTIWITNGVSNKKVSKNDIIPNGWVRGRVLKK